MKINESEAGETSYRLKILNNMDCLDNSGALKIIEEAKEQLAIFTSIANKILNEKMCGKVTRTLVFNT
jgi:hypothetical protein